MVDNRGKTPKEIESNGHPLIEVNAVSPDSRCPNYSAIRKYVNDTIYNDWFRSGHPQIDDILIPTVGTLGSVSLMDRNDCCIAQNLVALRCDTNICNPEFLYYVLRDRNVRRRLLKLDIGGVQPSIKVPHLMQFKIAIPAISTQEKIASILSTLDDKIAVNRRICENLESQAQALFKHWFIDFAPFKDGKFVESELGMIPEGWRVGTIAELCVEIGSGGTPKTSNKEYYQGTTPWFGTGEFNDSFLFDSEKHITKEAIENSSARLYPIHTVLIAMYGATVGKLSILSVDGSFNQAALGLVAHNYIGYPYIYLNLLNNRKPLINLACGAAQQNLNAGNIKSFVSIVPRKEVLEGFNDIVSPLFDLIENCCKENLRLSTLRDTLLPKLMSGQIKV